LSTSKGLLEQDGDFVRLAVEALVQAALEAEMDGGDRRRQGRAQRDADRLSQRLLRERKRYDHRPE
jgi:hypothetical protein